MERYDAIVLGLGGMGSAAAMHLASRGAKVLGLERHGPLHDHGSSHGETRLIRRAYFESPAYVPLLDRSYELWDALGAAVGEPLLHRAGLALFGSGSAPGARAAVRSTARTFGIDVEELDAPHARERFPMFSVGDDASLLWELGAGYLRVERCLQRHGDVARRAPERFCQLQRDVGRPVSVRRLFRPLEPRHHAEAVAERRAQAVGNP